MRCIAEGAAKGKHSRYPAFALPGGRLVPLSVETFGRWGSEALKFLRGAAEATCERWPQLAFLGARGPALLLGAWHTRLSVALQTANAALAFARPAEFGERRTSSGGTAGRAGRRTSRACCATRPPPPPLGTSMDRRAGDWLWRRVDAS